MTLLYWSKGKISKNYFALKLFNEENSHFDLYADVLKIGKGYSVRIIDVNYKTYLHDCNSFDEAIALAELKVKSKHNCRILSEEEVNKLKLLK